MFSISLLLLSTHLVLSLAAPPLLVSINPASLTSSVNLNSTILKEVDPSTQALSLPGSHISVLSPPRNTTTVRNIDEVVYPVPNTRTTIHMRFRQDRPLDRRSLGGFLLLMEDQVQKHIRSSGDGWLLPEDDPFKRDWPGFYFIAKSPPLPLGEGEGRLSYGVLINALKGLFNVMYLGEARGIVGPLPYGCYCSIENDAAELLGTAVIWPGPIHLL